MRITGGKASGIEIYAPKSGITRPVLERTRVSLFASLRDFENKCVADLFAGSGSFGLESASRGATKIIFVEKNPNACQTIQNNILKLKKSGLLATFIVARCDVFSYIRKNIGTQSFDYIFIDPPYKDTEIILQKILSDANFAKFAGGGLIIVKIPEKFDVNLALTAKYAEVINQKRFGGTDFIFLRIKQDYLS